MGAGKKGQKVSGLIKGGIDTESISKKTTITYHRKKTKKLLETNRSDEFFLETGGKKKRDEGNSSGEIFRLPTS